MKLRSTLLFAALALLVLAGCTPKREFTGHFRAYCPFVESGGGSITFDNGRFKLTGRVDSHESTTITITGTYTAEPTVLHLSILNVDYSGLEKLDKIGRDLAKSDKDNLLEIKNMDLSVTWVSDYVALLKSTAKGPGPLGETNFILERNEGQAAKLFGAVGTSFSYVSKGNEKPKTPDQPSVVFSVPKKVPNQDLPSPDQADSPQPPPPNSYDQQPGPAYPPDQSQSGSSQDDNQSQQGMPSDQGQSGDQNGNSSGDDNQPGPVQPPPQ